MKPTPSEIEKLRERYLQNKYPGDLSEILRPRDNVAPPGQIQPIHEDISRTPSLIRWSLAATLLLGLTFGLVWKLAPIKPVAPQAISLSKKPNSKLQTPQRSSLWLSGYTTRIFQKDNAVKNAFLKSTSTCSNTNSPDELLTVTFRDRQSSTREKLRPNSPSTKLLENDRSTGFRFQFIA